jgi:hypothetical protein
MADMYTPEEIQAIFDAVAQANAKQIPLSKELAVAYEDAKKGVKNYTRELDASLKKLGSSAVSLAKSIKDNKQGADVFTDSISSGADAVAKYTSKFGLLGQVIGGVIKAGSAYIGAVNKQSDALYKSYQELSRFGATGAGGMSDVFANLKRFGYGVEELGNMTALIAESSKELAVFNGSVFGGARELANLSADITDAGLQRGLMNMGMSVDEINKGNRAYYLQMGRLNRQQQITTQGAAAYHTEMEALTRLTGQSRKEMEDQRLQALQMDEVFAAINKSADPEKIFAVFNTITNPRLRKAIGQSLNGIVGQSEEQMQYIQATNGRIVDLSMQLQQGAISIDDFNKELALSLKDNMAVRENISVIAGAGKFMGESLFDDAMYIQKYGRANSTTLEGMTKEAKMAAMGFDSATDSATGLRISQMKSRDAMENFVNVGVKPVTAAMEILAKAVEYLTLMIPFGGRAKAQYEKEKADAAKQQVESAKTGSYLDKMIKAESGGRNIGNLEGTSSAFGIAQMTKGTFEGLASKAGPNNPLHGKTFDDMKGDVRLQMEAAKQLTDQNRQFLESRKLPTTDAALYLAHFLGPGGAARALSASDGAPISTVVGADQLDANQVLRNMSTVADLKSWANNKMGGSGFRFGGIASGPTSGYQAMLHGTEAVVPLNDGRSIPVTNTSSPEQMGAMSAQLDKLDELISVMKNQLSVSSRILQMQS